MKKEFFLITACLFALLACGGIAVVDVDGTTTHYDNLADLFRKSKQKSEQRKKNIAIRKEREKEKNLSKALVLAAKAGNNQEILTLLSQGANVNGRAEDKTPLATAINNGHIDTVKLLIEKGADINSNVRYGYSWYTPVELAIVTDKYEIAKLLIRQGANLTQNHCGKAEDAVNACLGGTGGESGSGGAFIQAIVHKDIDLEVLELMVERGANVNLKTTKEFAVGGVGFAKGYTPLTIAAKLGNANVVRFLLSKGAEVNYHATHTASTALGLAAENGHTETVRVLLNHRGIDVNAVDWDNDTPLKMAEEKGHTEIVQMLKAAGGKKKDLAPTCKHVYEGKEFSQRESFLLIFSSDQDYAVVNVYPESGSAYICPRNSYRRWKYGNDEYGYGYKNCMDNAKKVRCGRIPK